MQKICVFYETSCSYTVCSYNCWQWGSCVIKMANHLNLTFTASDNEINADMSNLARSL